MTNRRIKLVVAYDGYDFCGWWPQDGLRTVHGTLTEGIQRVIGRTIEIVGASRTDSGAHAEGQVCHFDDPAGLPTANWVRALNDALPPDLAVKKATVVANDFHSRFSAIDRFYRYRIASGVRDPRLHRYVHFHWSELDLNAMQRAGSAFEGRHDFRWFSQGTAEIQNTVRLIKSVNVHSVGNEVRIDVVGQAFIRGMMRRIAGSLLEVGRGVRTVESVQQLLETDRNPQKNYPILLPAHGLCLKRIRYGRHPQDHRFTTTEEQENEE